jgi:thioredoxin 1
MFIRLVFGILAGAVIGGLLGYFGKCTTGACPLTANPLRGMMVGAMLGGFLIFLLNTGSSGKENSMVITVGNKEAFEKAKNSKGVVLADFYAEWCYPCKLLSPVLEKVAEKYQGKAVFIKVDVSQFAELANENKVEATPTVLIFKDGKEAMRLVGLKTEADYGKVIEKLSEGTGNNL